MTADDARPFTSEAAAGSAAAPRSRVGFGCDFGLPQILVLLATILIVGTAAVLMLPAPHGRALATGSEWIWTPFSRDGGDYHAPREWLALDAFTTRTPYHGLAPTAPICPLSSHLAYLSRRSGEAELFLVHGTLSEVEPLVAAARRTMRAQATPGALGSGTATTADGTSLQYEFLRAQLGPEGGRDVTYFLATGFRGSDLLVLCGGALTRDFVLEEFLTIARGVRSPS
jgi:hypothetical protein